MKRFIQEIISKKLQELRAELKQQIVLHSLSQDNVETDHLADSYIREFLDCPDKIED